MLQEFVVCHDCASSIKKGVRLLKGESICGRCHRKVQVSSNARRLLLESEFIEIDEHFNAEAYKVTNLDRYYPPDLR